MGEDGAADVDEHEHLCRDVDQEAHRAPRLHAGQVEHGVQHARAGVGPQQSLAVEHRGRGQSEQQTWANTIIQSSTRIAKELKS